MKKAQSAKALLASLSLGLSTATANGALLHDISNDVEQIHVMIQQDVLVSDIFESIERLTATLQKLNISIKARIKHIDEKELSGLTLVNNALNYGIVLIKARFEKEIFNHYFSEFKRLSSAKNTLEVHLQHIKERLYGVEIVSIKDVTVTQSEINEAMAKIAVKL